jgi:hypothetical protein
MNAQSIVARERNALEVHRASLRGGALPPPKSAPRGTFLHGFFLPFSLLLATLRAPELRKPFLRVFAVRTALLAAIGVVALATGDREGKQAKPHHDGVTYKYDLDDDKDDDDSDDDTPRKQKPEKPVDVDVPGLHVHVDEKTGQAEMSVLGKPVPIELQSNGHPAPAASASAATPAPPAPRPPFLVRARDAIKRGWVATVAFVGLLSVAEGFIVFFSRRWDDWMSFHVSQLGGIRPEMPTPPVPKVAFDIKWLKNKLRRRIRGYVIFASGMPLLYLLKMIPVAGTWIFSAAITVWAWYWMGVFTASKNAHAWADDGVAGSPHPVRVFNTGVSKGCLLGPLRLYGRIWAWAVKGLSAPAAVFERTPAPFLGLALARAILALPGLYLLARPIVPVAAGRLCAEADPQDRFSLP